MFFDWFLRGNDPFEGAVLTHLPHDEFRVAGEKGDCCSEEIGGVLRESFLGFAAINVLGDFVEAGVGGTQAGDARIILLDQTLQRNIGRIGGEAYFEKCFGLFFFGRIELREARTKNFGLPIVVLRRDDLLFDGKFE